ncbi:MAG: M20/M25/M40 family metallo-hydrolase [Candidatus Krumholzibacteriia bacterium]
MARFRLLAALAALFAPPALRAAPPPAPAPAAVMTRLLAAAQADSHAWARLGELCDLVGPRLNGSDGQARAVTWALAEMRADGLTAVRAEPVQVPHWVRGEEAAECLAPLRFPLPVLGLGGTVGTPPGGIEAPLLAVRDFAELTARAAEARGRIVLFDPPWEGYGRTVQYRGRGADTAAKLGAVACLIRSVTDVSLATLHTGIMHYADRADSAWAGVPRIPAAALTVEDAGRLHRLERAGHPVRVRLSLGAQTLPDAESANVVGEVRGRERPDEIVVIGAHLDSWDVGTGAHDDGAGCVIVLEAARLLARLESAPRRTVRVVLFADEENSQSGGRAYGVAHADELARHVAALECDSGGFAPTGFSVQGDSIALAQVRALAAPLAAVGADSIAPGGSGVDVSFIVKLGVPGLGHRVEGARYFAYHHSPADTFDKIDAGDLAKNVAAVAALAWALADAPEPLHRVAPTP